VSPLRHADPNRYCYYSTIQPNTHYDITAAAHADPHCDIDACGNDNTDCDGVANSYTYFNTKTSTDPETSANAQAASYAVTAPIACVYENETHCSIRLV
jgi:hypothetical protein